MGNIDCDHPKIMAACFEMYHFHCKFEFPERQKSVIVFNYFNCNVSGE